MEPVFTVFGGSLLGDVGPDHAQGSDVFRIISGVAGLLP
jgi:hypothetical protein